MTERKVSARNTEVEWRDGSAREGTRALLLCLADNKRLLGVRYSDRMLGSPSLETGIAAASMAQDEWGHSRLTYALLSDFGDDPKQLEHERRAAEYLSMDALDRPFGSYPTMIAAVLLLDGAITAQYEALAESRYTQVRNRVQKLLEEEVLHEHFAMGWAHRLAQSAMRDEFVRELTEMLPQALRWFGPADDPSIEILRREGIVSDGPTQLRATLLRKVGPILEQVGLSRDTGLRLAASGWAFEGALDWSGWDPARRRVDPGGPDPDTLSRVRGDRNRVMLIE